METDRVPLSSMQYSQRIDAELWAQKQMDHTRETSVTKAPKVHVNPNFRNGKNLVIHINPRIHQNRKILVNPKMMKELAAKTESNEQMKIDDSRVREVETPVHSEPVPRSIHVNPKLMEKLSSIARDDIEANSSKASGANCDKTGSPVRSNKIVNDFGCGKTLSKPLTPRLLAISRRKLVRIGSNNKPTSCVKRKSLPGAQARKSPAGLSKFVANKNNKYKLNAYKIDRTVADRSKRKKTQVPDARIRDVNKGLVAIGGVMYQSSRTQLVRSGTGSSVHKKKNCPANGKSDTFVMAKNGKKLHRLRTSKEGTNRTRYMISRNVVNRDTTVKKLPNSVVQSSHKNVISYKAKQRSMQILRDKLRKNFIPCLIYRRFGYCANHAKGTCSKLHDKKQVALCRNFLQGKCLLDECPMSHDIGPEKMPTCKYFLEGCCIRDACPYLHVKVSANTPICAEFLRGYCADGNKCKQRHANVCPEFEKSGKCAKGKYCPYPHKLKSSAASASKSSVKTMRTSSSSKSIPNHRSSSNTAASSECSRKRYYEKSSPSAKQLSEMRESILKKMKCMKAALGLAEVGVTDNSEAIIDIDNSAITIDDDDEQETDFSNDERPRRPPIGPLPAFIPIN